MFYKTGDADTIAAISTPVGEGGIGIIRLSGLNAFKIGQEVFFPKRKGRDYPRSHRMYYGFIKDDEGDILDEVMVTFIKTPYTYTKEDIVEINCHSGIIILRMILQLVLNKGARMAEPGEFTQRAFINGRIDLSQAESVLNLVKARSEKAAKSAVKIVKGELSPRIKKLREKVITLIAHAEASIDFPEEVQTTESNFLAEELKFLYEEIEDLCRSAEKGTVFQEGLKVSIVGKPNVGKSSLLNSILKKQRAIVTEIPGTTRDLLEEQLHLNGLPVCLIDTAGIRKTKDPVESIGVNLSREAIEASDLVLFIVDAHAGLSEEDYDINNLIHEENKKHLIVINKTDLKNTISDKEIEKHLSSARIVRISVKKGIGLEEIENAVISMVEDNKIATGESPMIINLRHRDILSQIRGILSDLRGNAGREPIDIICIDLKIIEEKLGEITGETAGDDILNRVFSDFCIGK